ncbi:hypothetical protein V7200_17500 [Cytobacillus firmus]|uniref:Uncharacterized protein n=1 Tax=Cytobacillus firmus TaxID=1399 RepID=A0A800N997_CYTFI|nr:hypothetical protein [Cytobacillus firmus]KAF0822339.1 hypothetical protein KIS1582_3879 [Cytobacillus firmus]
MTYSVYFDGGLLGKALYQSAVSLALFCEQQGFEAVIDQHKETINIETGRKQHPISISARSKNQPSQDAVLKLNDILKAEGLDLLKEPSIIIYLDSIDQQYSDQQLIIEHNVLLDERLKNLLIIEFNKAKIPFVLNEKKNLAADGKQQLAFRSQFNEDDRLILSISRAFIRYCSVKPAANNSAIVPMPLIKSWLSSFLDQARLPNTQERKAVTKVPEKTMKPEKNKNISTVNSQDQRLKKANAEVFLNYTMLIPRSDGEEKEYMVNGSIIMKNTGDIDLKNPVICIKIPVEQGISLQGQILPPKLVAGLAMKGSDGEKGWKYVYDDWRDRVKTKGEYWITSIQELTIPPGGSEVFNGLKVLIREPKNSSVGIHAFVYFNEGKQQYASNNTISLSF